MKKTLIIIILILSSIKLIAQDSDFAINFQQNPNLINPAYLTKNNFITSNFLYNKTWIYPGAPTYSTIWMSGKFTEHMGAGLQISTKNIGIFSKTQLSLSYAFEITLNKRTHTYLSFGIAGGLLQDFYNTSQMHIIFTDPFLQQANLNRYYPQASTGIMLYNEFFNIGISAFRLLPKSGYFITNQTEILSPVIIFHWNYLYKDPLERYSFSPALILSLTKEKYYLEAIIASFTRPKTIKYGIGLNTEFITDYKSIVLGFNTFIGFRISERFFIIYKFNLNSINTPSPLLTKIGNSIAIRFDFYQYKYNIPDFF